MCQKSGEIINAYLERRNNLDKFIYKALLTIGYLHLSISYQKCQAICVCLHFNWHDGRECDFRFVWICNATGIFKGHRILFYLLIQLWSFFLSIHIHMYIYMCKHSCALKFALIFFLLCFKAKQVYIVILHVELSLHLFVYCFFS